MLRQLGVSFVKQCDWAIEFAKDFVVQSLAANMLKSDPDVASKAPRVAEALSNLGDNKSHERHFHYQDCVQMGLKVEMLEDDEKLQDLLLTVHHCYMHALSNSSAIKFIENQTGNALVKQVPIQQQPNVRIGVS